LTLIREQKPRSDVYTIVTLAKGVTQLTIPPNLVGLRGKTRSFFFVRAILLTRQVKAADAALL
jgi:hypothetical protein